MNDVIKIQAFVRGCLCRARVSVMVQKLIDEILSTRRSEEANEDKVAVDETQADEMENSTSSLGVTEIKPNKTRGSFSRNNESLQGSVSNILSKFEAKKDPDPRPPARKWVAKKPQEEKPQEEKQQEEKQQEEKEEKNEEPVEKQQVDEKPPVPEQPPSIEKVDSSGEDKKDSELPARGQKNSYVKNIKLQSNATKNVSSSAKVVEEQEMRMNEEIQQLLEDIKRIGEPGEPFVEFGELFDDEKVANYYEALVGTLKAAKKKKLIKYEGQFLLKGMNDKVVISIV